MEIKLALEKMMRDKTIDTKNIQKPTFEDNIGLDVQYDISDNINSMEQISRDTGNAENLEKLRLTTSITKDIIESLREDKNGCVVLGVNDKVIAIRKGIFVSELNQIIESHTIARAAYYFRRVKKGIVEVKTSKINDINLNRWKEYDDIITDSLWVINKRDTSGAHLGWYWGNFIPQIPNQMMRRYSKKGDWILDPFVGSGTTIIESKKLGRNGIGIELIEDIAEKARILVEKEPNIYDVVADIVSDDSSKIGMKDLVGRFGIKKFQLIIAHPPYHDIIQFSEDKDDLSVSGSTQDFLKKFGNVIDNISPFLENDRYFALVIGDKYKEGEWIPLGFYCMNEMLKRNYELKSTIIKNFNETRAKRNGQELWRYRALVGGFYVFKHEYIFVFKKKAKKRS